jgi:alpha-beta hydrolase superfamily lysophospholipase
MIRYHDDLRFLYVHGMEEDAQVWGPLIDVLGEAGAHFAIELPWGTRCENDWVLSDDRLEDQLRLAAQNLLAPHRSPTVAVAHSFGGLAVLEYLHRHGTAAFDALVLIAPFYRFAGHALDWAKLKSLGDHYRRFLQECVAVRLGAEVESDILQRMAEHVRERIGPVGCIEFLHHYNRSARIDLTAIALPVLVIAGEDDYYCSRREAEEIAGAFPVGRSVVLPDTGHFCMLDLPHAVASHILDFLAEARCVQPALVERSI